MRIQNTKSRSKRADNESRQTRSVGDCGRFAFTMSTVTKMDTRRPCLSITPPCLSSNCNSARRSMTKHGRVARHMKTNSPVKHKNTRIQRKTKLTDRQSKTAAVIFQPRSLQKKPETLVILRRRKDAICEMLDMCALCGFLSGAAG